MSTNCPVTFISPIGGYAYGAQGAQFIVENLPPGGTVLALRISPGVDVLETRWSAAEQIFKEAGVRVLGDEFTGDDRATTKQIVMDYLNRFGQIDAVWMDAGATTVAASKPLRIWALTSRSSSAKTSKTSSPNGRRRPDGHRTFIPDFPMADGGFGGRHGVVGRRCAVAVAIATADCDAG